LIGVETVREEFSSLHELRKAWRFRALQLSKRNSPGLSGLRGVLCAIISQKGWDNERFIVVTGVSLRRKYLSKYCM